MEYQYIWLVKPMQLMMHTQDMIWTRLNIQ